VRDPTLALAVKHALLEQVRDDLLDEERVALGLAMNGPGQDGVDLAPAEGGAKLHHLVLAEAANADASVGASTADRAHDSRERVAVQHLDVAIGRQDQES